MCWLLHALAQQAHDNGGRQHVAVLYAVRHCLIVSEETTEG